jgi:hypothetical protein
MNEESSPNKKKYTYNNGLQESVFSVSTKAFNFYNIHDEFEDQNQEAQVKEVLDNQQKVLEAY